MIRTSYWILGRLRIEQCITVEKKIILDGNTVEIVVGYRGHVAYFYSAKYLPTADLLICGKWKIVNGCLIVEITEDNIFDGKYTKLVFRPLDTE